MPVDQDKEQTDLDTVQIEQDRGWVGLDKGPTGW